MKHLTNKTLFQSEEAQEIVSKIPTSIANYIILFFFAFFTLLISLAYFIKYPDLIVAPVKIIGEKPAINIVSPASGKIEFFPLTNSIKEKSTIALIQNPTDYYTILKIKKSINHLTSANTLVKWALTYHSINSSKLGELEQSYNQMKLSVDKLKSFLQVDKTTLEIEILNDQIKLENEILENQENSLHIQKNKFLLIKNKYSSDSTLFSKNALVYNSFANTSSNLLESETQLLNNKSSTLKVKETIASLKGAKLSKGQEYIRQYNNLILELEYSISELKNKIHSWEQRYLIISPISGKLEIFGHLRNNFYVTAGQQLFTIIPENQSYSAIATVPIYGAGKVNLGSNVNLKLHDYPYQEFGYLSGKVNKINSVTQEFNNSNNGMTGAYSISINLNSNISNYDKEIICKNNMLGNAEIITKKRSFLNRVFDKITSLFS